MTKQQKMKAFREAIKRAKETIAFYEKKTLEELEAMDTSELSCLGCDFNWLPNSGYDYDKERADEEVAWLCECADHREKRKERFYMVSFFEKGNDQASARFGVCFRGLKDKNKPLKMVLEQYPQYSGYGPKVEALSKAEYIANF